MPGLPSSPDAVQNGTEERRWPRYHVEVPVTATVLCQGTSKVVHGVTNNLSVGGMAAQLPVELGIGESLEVQATLPYCSQPLKVRAVVRNRDSYLYGVEFANITPSQQAAIELACRSLALLQ